jgi:ribose-phosphate pyrophosphokinase
MKQIQDAPMLPVKLFTGSSNPELCHKVARELGLVVGDADVKRFSDGEVDICFNESVREHDVFLMQSTSYPGNDHLMELLLMVDACRRASAARVNAVMPYFGYSRQDRQMRPRVPISAKVVANMLTAAGVDRLITIDIHAAQIQAFFDIPVDHLRTAYLLTGHLEGLGLQEPVVVSPDAGGVELASIIAMGLAGTMALIDRRRGAPAKAKAMHLVGDVEGRDCVLVDDMIDTAGTLTEAADLLITSGARSVRAAVTHPVLSGSAIERLDRSKISELIVTDTIVLPVEKHVEKITVVSVAPLVAAAIRAIHTGDSVSSLS